MEAGDFIRAIGRYTSELLAIVALLWVALEASALYFGYKDGRR